VRFSVTARMDTKITRAIAGIPEDAWTPIRYPNAIYDEDEQRWISDAEVAETLYTAFTSTNNHRGDRPADRAPGPPSRPAHPG
jgi:hypothetical protein